MKIVLILVVVCAFAICESSQRQGERRGGQRRPSDRGNRRPPSRDDRRRPPRRDDRDRDDDRHRDNDRNRDDDRHGDNDRNRDDSHRGNDRNRDDSHGDNDRNRDDSHGDNDRNRDDSHRDNDRNRDDDRHRDNDRNRDDDHHRDNDRNRDDDHRRPPMRDNHNSHQNDQHHRPAHINVNTVPLTDCTPETLAAVEQYLVQHVPDVCQVIAPYCTIIDGYAQGAFYCQVEFRATNVMQQCCGGYTNNTTLPGTTQAPATDAPTTTAAPATAAPTTEEPITEAPTTVAPTTGEPTTDAPTTTQAATTVAPRTCGQSSINPASKSAEFEAVRLSLRIVGGSTTQDCQYPWMAQLTIGEFLCGGSIIDETHILTAAHCVAGMNVDDTNATLGQYNINIKSGKEQTIQASQLTFHENYDQNTFENDIAIITLAEPIEFGGCVQPVCLPDSSTTFTTGTDCTVAGWGTTTEGGNIANTMQEVEVDLYTSPDCLSNFPNYQGSVFESTICAGYPEGGMDACQGDSGGPLVCPSDGSWIQMGVVSSGYGCARQDYPGLYTNVAMYTDWIAQNV